MFTSLIPILPVWDNKCENCRTEFINNINYSFHYTNFHKTMNYCTKSCGHLTQCIVSRLASMGNVLFPPMNKSMALIVPNCMMCLVTAHHYWDILCAVSLPNSYVPFRQSVTHCLFSWNSYMLDSVSTKDISTEFNDSLTFGIVANTRSWTDKWWTWSVQKAFFLLRTECPQCSHTHILEV